MASFVIGYENIFSIFDRDFMFPVSRTQMYRQLGKSVVGSSPAGILPSEYMTEYILVILDNHCIIIPKYDYSK